MGKRSRMRERDIADAVDRAGRSKLSPVDVAGQGVDLSPAATAARARASARGRDGGYTGRELIEAADLAMARAKRLAKVAVDSAGRRSQKRRQRADQQADELLRNAAAQVRIAQLTPLTRPYLHALTIEQIQTVKAEVSRAFEQDPAALAVDTTRRIIDQRLRVRAESGA